MLVKVLLIIIIFLNCYYKMNIADDHFGYSLILEYIYLTTSQKTLFLVLLI